MDTWFLILITISICILFNVLFKSTKNVQKLPPGPPTIPIISDLRLLFKTRSTMSIESVLKNLKKKYGPIIIIHAGGRLNIFITTNTLAFKALIQNGAIFADRPRVPFTTQLFSANQRNITLSPYGPSWRALRRNLTSEILHPSRVRSYSHARKWVLDILVNRLQRDAESGASVQVMEHFRYTMFCLLVLMCFGDKLDEKQIQEIEAMQHQVLLVIAGKFNVFNMWRSVTKIVFRKRWEQLQHILNEQYRVLTPLIKAREKIKHEKLNDDEHISSYVDTLLEFQLPEEKRKVNIDEIVALCSEFLDAGTDTTSTALEWIMANITKYPHIQENIYTEIQQVINGDDKLDEIKEEDLKNLPYLKAVILEGLRRHPPAHFVLPHAATEDVTFEEFSIPKNAILNFLVADISSDPNVWKDPMEFKPERFFNNDEVFDITGTRGIKMMPFGAGRRICPGYSLAMLHLEYFVANLVWKFKWSAVDDVDLSEKMTSRLL
ncbi:hypothetical protein ACFE04_031023 [Oxalis oulophora]